MNTAELLKYFAAEKSAALLLLALAVAGVSLGLYLRVNGSPFRAMAWVLFPVAAIQLAVGAGLLVRTGPQMAALQQGLAQSPAQTVVAEKERMAKVNRSWLPIKVVEVGLIAVGLGLIVFGATSGHTYAAVGMGLVLEAAVMLVFDIFAEQRAVEYSAWLAALATNVG